MWSVFKAATAAAGAAGDLVTRWTGLFEQLDGKDVTVRGTYDVAGLRATPTSWSGGTPAAGRAAGRLWAVPADAAGRI